LVLSTTFHPIYGRSEILITWEMLKPYLRPKTFATKLVEN
jgi:hypothetical protein